MKNYGALAFTFAVAATLGTAQAGQVSFSEAGCQVTAYTASSVTCSTTVAGTSQATTMSAWSAGSTSNFSSAAFGYYPSAGAGIGAQGESLASPQHAIDNNGGTDAFLINFGSLNVALNQLSIGWLSGDADVSVLRYTGTQAPSLGNFTAANLRNAQGWDWVGDYSTLTTNPTLNFNTGSDVKTASWWLVSAYNSAYSANRVGPNLSNGDDYFKLSGFRGDIVTKTPPANDVPEPGTFALFGIAILGFAAVRRNLKAK